MIRELTFNEGENALVVLECLLLLDQVDLVLEDDNVLELHDLDGGQVFACLRLRACLIAGNEEEGGIHDRCTVKHRGHQNIVTWAINERDMANELHSGIAAWTLAWGVIFLVGSVRPITAWSGASFIFALVDLRISKKVRMLS